MMIGVRVLLAGGLGALLAGGAHPALAQGVGSNRPFRGLFGNASDQTARHKLDARMSVAAAYDSNVLGAGQAAGLIGLEAIGQTGILTTGVEYQWRGRWVQVDLVTTSGLRYYPALERIRTVSHTGVASVAALLPARSVAAFNQTAAYTPSYLYALFPRLDTTGVETPPSADYAVNGSEAYSYVSTLTYGYNVTGQNSLAAAGEFQQTDVRGLAATRQSLVMYGMSGQYSRRLGRNASAKALYRFRTGDVAQGIGGILRTKLEERGAEVGGDYRVPFSATRYLLVEGTIGAAALVLPESAKARSVRDEPYRVLGNLSVAYRFRRTWQARAAYRGSIEYVAGIAEPVSTDGITANVGGWLARRIELTGSAAYSNGESSWNPSSVRFDTYTGNARLRYTLTRMLDVYAEYLYYFYDFRGAVALGPGIPNRLERNGGRTGFNVRVPMVRSR